MQLREISCHPNAAVWLSKALQFSTCFLSSYAQIKKCADSVVKFGSDRNGIEQSAPIIQGGEAYVWLPRVVKQSGFDPNLMNFIVSSSVKATLLHSANFNQSLELKLWSIHAHPSSPCPKPSFYLSFMAWTELIHLRNIPCTCFTKHNVSLSSQSNPLGSHRRSRQVKRITPPGCFETTFSIPV